MHVSPTRTRRGLLWARASRFHKQSVGGRVDVLKRYTARVNETWQKQNREFEIGNNNNVNYHPRRVRGVRVRRARFKSTSP